MRKFLGFSCLFLFLGGILSCGSGNGITTLSGPDLSIGELAAIKVDQLKFSGGLTDDSALDGIPEPTLYLRCADSDVDIACAGPEQGLDIVKKDGVSYGRLDVSFESVSGVTEDSCFDVKLVFVEKDSDACPEPINSDDDIIWTSAALTIDESGSGSLLKNLIGPADGSVGAYLISPADKPAEELLSVTLPQTEATLKLDQLYFKEPSLPDGTTNFKLVVKSDEGELIRCEAAFESSASGIEREGIIYGNLNMQLFDNAGSACQITEANKSEEVVIYLYSSASGNSLFTENAIMLSDLADDGEKVEFKDEKGYVKFAPVEGL
jgi:hypothetical protein